MTTPDDPGFWSRAATGIASIATLLVAALYSVHSRRIVTLEEKVDAKADKNELDRRDDDVKADVKTLYEGQAEIRREITTQSQKLQETLHGIHVDLLSKIGDGRSTDERKKRR